MSVIVKGMEMPKSCYDCPLHDGEYGICNILRTIIDDYIPKECPLVELVRCKECIHKGTDMDCWVNHRFVTDDFFCKDGKRRE